MARYTKVTINGKQYYKAQITQPSGKRKTLYGKTVSELREKEQKFRSKLSLRKATDSPTVAEYAKLQLGFMRQQVQPKTYEGYESKVRLYIAAPPLGTMRLTDVSVDDIRKALTRVAPLSASHYRTTHMLLRRIFGAAKRNNLIATDPTDDISGKGGKPPKEKYALSDEEATCLLSAVEGLPVETFVRLGLYAGLRREEILAMRWDCVHLDEEHPYIQVRRAWRIDHNRPIVSEMLKTPAAKRNIPIPNTLTEHLRAVQAASSSDYVICNRDGGPLSGSQWRSYWKKVTVRTTKEHTYTRYSQGKKETHTVKPKLGDHAAHNPHVVYSMAFDITPHKLRRTYVTNLIYAGTDPKTVQYLAGHENIKITMDIYAKLKYNRPSDIAPAVCRAFGDIQEEQDLS